LYLTLCRRVFSFYLASIISQPSSYGKIQPRRLAQAW
jgi:hypothetical protein